MWCFATVCIFFMRAPLHRLQAEGYSGKPNLWANERSMWYAAHNLRLILHYFSKNWILAIGPASSFSHRLYWLCVNALACTCAHMIELVVFECLLHIRTLWVEEIYVDHMKISVIYVLNNAHGHWGNL